MSVRGLWLLLLIAAAGADTTVEVKGVDDKLATNIRRHIGELSEHELQNPRLLRQKLDTAVPNALQALGYYGSRYQYGRDGDTLTLRVEPGFAVSWAEPDIRVEGGAISIEPIRSMTVAHPFESGQRIDHRSYERFKAHLLNVVQEYGFLDASYRQSRLAVDLDARRATVHLTLDSGPRYRIEELRFGGSKLETGLLQRLSPVAPGDWYRRSQITELRRTLQNSRYFRSVDVESLTDGPAGRIVDVELVDAPEHEFGVGLGYGTDTGPRTRLRWERAQVNRFGHHFLSEAKVSEPQQEVTASYRIPLSKPLYQNLNFNAGWERKNVADTLSSLGRVGITVSDRLWQHWAVNYGVNYEAETYRQGSEPRQSTGYLTPGANLTRVHLPSGIDPTSGYRTSFAISGSSKKLGADLGFLRTSLGHKQLIGLGGSHLLIARGEVGAIVTEDISRVPASKRFFTGGDQTVRGFDYETIASRDAQGELIGGRYLNVASLEYSFRFAERWRAAVFTDSGRAYNDGSESWRSSAGFGVRWLSPVGQIRVDLAFPVDDDINRDFRLHIFMGPPL